MWAVLVPLGIVGVWLGRGDVASGSALTGLAQALAGVIVVSYSVLAAVEDARRLSEPIRFIVARDGFAFVPRGHTVSWGEVDTIRDPRFPEDQPRTLRIHLADPSEFERRHSLTPFARLALRFNKGDLVLGSGISMPIPKAEDLMRQKLADFRRVGSAQTTPPAAAHGPRGRRPGHR
jgi:hypothetical protein